MTSKLREKLQEKAYRDAFVASQIRIALPFQIRALREQRGWTQAQLAEKAGMLQPRISAMERPGGSKFTLETVLRVAAALDIAFIGRFASFGKLAGWAENFSPDTFVVPSFQDDPGFQEQVTVPTHIQTTVQMANNALLLKPFQPNRLGSLAGINPVSTVQVTHNTTVSSQRGYLRPLPSEDKLKKDVLIQSHIDNNLPLIVTESP
jgi:transcriptional regulator with XRE-family HTH domain